MAAGEVGVQPEDEGLHTPVFDPLWSESFYLNFSDSRGQLGGFTRIARHPARHEVEGLLCVYLPAGGIGIVHLTGKIEPGDQSIQAGRLVYECMEPLNRWRVHYDGDVHVFADPSLVTAALLPGAPPPVKQHAVLDLDQSALHAPFFYPNYRTVTVPPPHRPPAKVGFRRALRRALRRPAEIVSALHMRSGRHYEQSMRVSGSGAFNGEHWTFEGSGHRDHSWGPRDWAPSERWRWLTGQMEGFAFNAMYLTIAGTHVTNGYVWHNGRCSPVDQLRLDSTFDDTGRAGRDLLLELTAAGETHLITGEVLLNVPLPITGPRFSTMYNVGRTRYRCGDRVGYGVAEFLERLDP
jgi:hypothetical protein